MYHSLAEKIKLTGGTALRQLRRDYEYLMELKEENLLFSYYTEAGLNGKLAFVPKGLHLPAIGLALPLSFINRLEIIV